MNLVNIVIDNRELSLDKNLTIIQACNLVNIEIPSFCYHENLSIAGNCRMCLVEVNYTSKLQVSCAINLTSKLKVITNSYRLIKARESILEFLLVNHPLDCPICDQGGECDLQDLSHIFGVDRGRALNFTKKAIEDFEDSPLIKTLMTRCIYCTRCVRFLQEVTTNYTLGLLGRGSKMEIHAYTKTALIEELTGNIIDLCPVGALTAKPFSFEGRSWEYDFNYSIDVLDSFCSSIRIDFYNNKVMRILPKTNPYLNDEWITNRIRFCVDALAYQRLVYPRVSLNYENKKVHINCDWRTLFEKLKNLFFYSNFDFVQMLCGPFTDYNSIIALKDFAQIIGTSNLSLNKKDIDFKENYLYSSSSTCNTEEDLALYIFLGFNPKTELSLLNVKLKNLHKQYCYEAFNFGEKLMDLGYPVRQMGNINKDFYKFLQGRHILCKKLFESIGKKVIIIVGSSLQQLLCFDYIKKSLNKMKKRFKDLIVNYIQITTANVSSYELGLVKGVCEPEDLENIKNNKLNKLLFYDISLIFEDSFLKNKENIIIYQGSHIDSVINYAKMIIPSNLFVEKNALYMNLAGSIQYCKFTIGAPFLARTDFEIFKALHLYFLDYLIKKNIINTEICVNIFTFIYSVKLKVRQACDLIIFRSKFYKRTKEEAPFLKFRNFFWILMNLNLNILRKMYKKECNIFVNKNVYNIYKKDVITLHSKILNLCFLEFKKKNIYNLKK